MKIVSIVGARPQFIKCATVSRELRRIASEVLVHTGQHYDGAMSDVFFLELDIPRPDYHLNIGSGPHGAQTGRMLERIEEVLLNEQPDCVLVYGDTNSTLAGALAAAKLNIPVAHVEAGLRSFNNRMPEETNRILTDRVAEVNFCPTELAVSNLAREGMHQGVHLVGDVMYDAALHYRERAMQGSTILPKLGLRAKEYVLATIHRAENTDHADRLRVIMDGLVQVARRTPVVLPTHPRTRAALQRNRLWPVVAGAIRLIEPAGYLDMVMLEANAQLIATDSGGVQKEAFFHQVPCVTLRNETEWVELVDLGWNVLCPPYPQTDIAGVIAEAVAMTGKAGYPYGKGDAARKISEVLCAA